MKRRTFIALVLLFLILLIGILKEKFPDYRYKLYYANGILEKLVISDKIKEGDIIFQPSLSKQCITLQFCSHSQYSNCGVVFRKKNSLYVLEAGQTVTLIPLNQWVAKGKDCHFIIKRIKNAGSILTPKILNEMKSLCNRLIGKKNDIYFEWSDEKLYSSELIWKLYKQTTGLEIAKLQKLMDFDLSTIFIKKILEERYGNNIPLEEPVVSPISILNSNLLETVCIE